MSEDIVIDGTTYPNVSTLEMNNANGEKVMFYPDAVRYNQQTLTEEQKAQARANIDAASADEVADLNVRIGQQHLLFAEGDTVEDALAWLAENGDTSKVYVLPDGFFYEYKETVVESGGVAYTNVLPLATTTDRTTIFHGTGYSPGGDRLSSSGTESATGVTNNAVTGFINNVSVGDVIRIKNFYAPQGASNYMISYNSSNTKVNHQTFTALGEATWKSGTWYTVDGTGYDKVTTITLTEALFGTGFDAIRFAGVITADTIVTVNQEIKEGGGTSIVSTWASTGQAFVPTDYDEVISELVNITDAHATAIANLQANGGGTGTGSSVDESRVDALETTATQHGTRIANLETLTSQHSEELAALKTTIENGASNGDTSDSATNLLATATDADRTTIYGSDYNGDGVNDGYLAGRRLSGSSGTVATAGEACCVSGFIPVSEGDILYLKGTQTVSGTSTYVISYNSSNALVKYQGFSTGINGAYATGTWYTVNGDTVVIPITSENFGTGFDAIRFSAHIDENSVVTVKKKGSTGGTGSITDLTPEESLELIRNWDKPIYERLTPFLLDTDMVIDTTYPKTYTDSADPNGTYRRQNVQAVYDEYNALCTAHPDFVRDITNKAHGLDGATETTFGGLCSDGVQYVRVYEFCEREGRHSNTTNADYWSETKPTFIIVTGIHWEYNGVYSMLHALKLITENPALRDMRRNCRFIVIPMSNPYCFTTYGNSGGGHYNANGVEIHNNFKVDFNNTIDATHGTAPLSEVETRYIDNAMRKYADTGVCLLTCHSNATKGSNFIWGSVATKFMCNVSMRLVDLMSYAWDEKYDNYRSAIDTQKVGNSNPQEDGDYRCGFASLSTSTGTETKQALWYGMQGINVEVYEKFYLFDPNGTDTALAINRGAEVYVNLLRLLAVTYDHNDRDKYAPIPPYKTE